MSLLEIAGVVLSYLVVFVGGVVLHSVLVSDVNKLLASAVTALNDLISKLPKV